MSIKVSDTGPNSKRWILEHHHVMAKHIGRALKNKETVHHKNGVRDDNRLENLVLMSSSHPAGQEIPDKVVWAKDIIDLYGMHFGYYVGEMRESLPDTLFLRK